MIDPFELKIREIFYLVGEYGINNTPDYKFEGKTDDEKKQFLINCRKGFRLGQDILVKEMVKVLQAIKQHSQLEKEAKRQRNKERIEELTEIGGRLQYELALYRHFADFLAWMVFRNEWHKIRRFYSGSKSRPSLLESNLKDVLDAVEHFHSLDDLNFALITDLTSFVDIGDLIVMADGKVLFVECKSGDVQRRVFEFMEEMRADDFDPKKVDYSNKDEKFFGQLERTLRQYERSGHAVNYFNTEDGIDPFSKKTINLSVSSAKPAYYFKELTELAEKSWQNDSAYGSVEDVLFISAFRDTKLEPASFVFNRWMEQISENYISCDLMQLVYVPLKEPLMFKPIGKEVIFDLMFNRLKIFIGLDLDKLIALFNKEKGVAARWLSEKETKQQLSRGGPKPFVHKGRGIEVKTKAHTIMLGTTFTVHLMMDNLTPSALVDRYATLNPTAV